MHILQLEQATEMLAGIRSSAHLTEQGALFPHRSTILTSASVLDEALRDGEECRSSKRGLTVSECRSAQYESLSMRRLGADGFGYRELPHRSRSRIEREHLAAVELPFE